MNRLQHKICKNGHAYSKISDCPVCPICENERKPKDSFMANLSAPARRALQNSGIETIAQLSLYTESDILKLHGIGSSSIPKLREALASVQLTFKN